MSHVNLSKVTTWLHEINSIPTLQVLHLRYTHLPHIAAPLPPFNLTSIATLDLSGYSSFNTAVLRWFSNASSLRYLDLAHCDGLHVEPLQAAVGALSNLNGLCLSSCNIEGDIDGILRNISSSFNYLDLSSNELTGTIPRANTLDISNNNISGELTDLINGLSNCSSGSQVSAILVRNNNLKGIIPSSLGQLSRLQSLDLSSNSLQGDITQVHFSHLTKLKHLDIADNSLNVTLSHDWLPPFNALSISMSTCHIGTQFPTWIQTQYSLDTLHLNKVGLSGNLPTWLSDFISKRLVHLSMHSNNLTGRFTFPTQKADGSLQQLIYWAYSSQLCKRYKPLFLIFVE
ncbi:LRR receptor-like serine threonine-protein kinase [Musa troglodytarum]|uniref:LRR receptor-like serine threonine-protein kinase n=1 Tax=Musa troglodytarum TaxID=320322 RepID=A0A9E7KXM6_9LILI|nr:LRR receptor-like serine threonine-protein kinase [Musa troglodytarum]